MNLASLSLCLLWCLAALPAHTQISKGKKLLEQRQYDAALEAFMNDLEKPANQPIALSEMARIYADERYQGMDLVQAYQYASRALNQFERLASADKKKVQAKGINQLNLSKLASDLLRRNYRVAQESNDLNTYNTFLEEIEGASQQQRKTIAQQRDQLAFDQATEKATYAAFQTLLEDYGSTMELYNLPLYKSLQKRLLAHYTAEKGWELYPQFEALYPNNQYVRDSETAYAFLNARRKNTLAAYKEFLQAYQRKPFAAFGIDGLYRLVMQSDDVREYDAFVRAYPDYEGLAPLWKRFYALYRQRMGTGAVAKFANAYPQYPFPEQLEADRRSAQTAAQKPLYDRLVAERDIDLVLAFTERYPSSDYDEQLEAPFYEALKINPLPRAAQLFLQRYPRSAHYDEVLVMYYDALTQDGELSTLSQFMMEHPEYKDIQRQQQDLALAEQGAQLRLERPFSPDQRSTYETYIKAAAPRERAWVALQRLLEADLDRGDYEAARATLKRYSGYFEAKPQRLQDLSDLLAQAQPIAFTDLNDQWERERLHLGDLSLSDERLLLSEPGVGRSSRVLKSNRVQRKWLNLSLDPSFQKIAESGARLEDVSADQHRAVWTVPMADGREELWLSEWRNGQWSVPRPFAPFGESPQQSSQGFLTADGRALLFSSNAPVGLLHAPTQSAAQAVHGNPRGNWDLFVCLRQENGSWSAPINLGAVINTPYEEGHAFLHPDGKTLYFSSEGRGGLGRLDVFCATRKGDSWTDWSRPMHLGAGVNSPHNEAVQAVDVKGKRLYLSREEVLLEGALPPTMRPMPVQVQPWTVQSLQGAPLTVNVAYRPLESTAPPAWAKASAGQLLCPQRAQQTYVYWVQEAGYWSQSYTSAGTDRTLTAYTPSDLIGSLLPLNLDKAPALCEADIARLADFLQQEELIILLPKGDRSVNGFTAASIEQLLQAAGCPASKLSWYTPPSDLEAYEGLLVGFDVLP